MNFTLCGRNLVSVDRITGGVVLDRCARKERFNFIYLTQWLGLWVHSGRNASHPTHLAHPKSPLHCRISPEIVLNGLSWWRRGWQGQEHLALVLHKQTNITKKYRSFCTVFFLWVLNCSWRINALCSLPILTVKCSQEVVKKYERDDLGCMEKCPQPCSYVFYWGK